MAVLLWHIKYQVPKGMLVWCSLVRDMLPRYNSLRGTARCACRGQGGTASPSPGPGLPQRSPLPHCAGWRAQGRGKCLQRGLHATR